MKSIARALNNIAIAITNLGRALAPVKEESKDIPVSNTVTSNPGNPNLKITSIYQNKNYKISHVPYEEKAAIDAIFNALTDKGSHPDHHDHVMKELATKWPTLHKALNQFVLARKATYNASTSQIWKNSK